MKGKKNNKKITTKKNNKKEITQKKNSKKRKIRYDRILIALVIVLIIAGFFAFLFSLKITNIVIKNNSYLTDQEIIELAGISDYPESLANSSTQIEQRLKTNDLIKDVKVTKKFLTQVYIEVEENRPLFYYNHNNKTVLLDGTNIDETYPVPTVLNYITDTYYDEFIKEMGNLDSSILNKISEIQFDPNDVDDNRFLLTMSDGNYVYVNISTFYKLNKYVSIRESLPDKNGILYLDYGNNFEIIE